MVDAGKSHKVKIFDWNTVESYAKKKILTGEELLAVKLEKGEEQENKKENK